MPENVLLIYSDQHRWDVVQRHNDAVSTPNLQRLSDEGATFDHCYCQVQACVPSRASLLTGLYAERHGLWNNQQVLPERFMTWPRHFRDNDYQAVAVGRTHHIDQGFDNVIRVPSGQSYPVNCHDPRMQIHWAEDAMIGPSPAPFEDYYETRIARTAAAFLEEFARSDKPFALQVGFLAPHAAFSPPEPYWSLYDDLEVSGLEEEAPPPADLCATGRRRDMLNVTAERFSRIVRGYYALVSAMDACIGILLDALERLGLSEDTLVIYTSDHGEQLGHRRVYGKCYGYDASMRIPLVLRCPGAVEKGVVSEALVEQIDLVPTICEAVGISPYPCNGRSFWSLCTGRRATSHREWIYSAPDSRSFCCRSHAWKWIRRLSDDGAVDEVYDLAADPCEQINLADTDRGTRAKAEFMPRLLDRMVSDFRQNATDIFPECRQPPLIPFFTT